MERRGSEPVIDSTFIIQNPQFGSDVLEKLNTFRIENSFTDVTLEAGCEEFPCHKNVLAVNSPYFKALFSCALKESTQEKISIRDVSAWTLRRIIEYAYTGRLEITVDNAQDMLAAGSLFQFPNVVDACCDFLSKHLHYTNCLGIEHFAHLHSCEDLEQKAYKYALDNFNTVTELDEFLELSTERLCKYLSSDLIDVSREESVFEAAMRWMRHDWPTRKAAACDVLVCVRFATVDVQYLCDTIQKEPIVANCDTLSEQVLEAIKYHESKSTDQHGKRRRSMQTESCTPRPSTVARQVLVVLGGFYDTNTPTDSVDVFDAGKEKWSSLANMPCTTSWFSVVALNNDIYVTGGINVTDGRIVRTMWKFQSSKRMWTKSTPMLSPRARHASSVSNGKIYVLGGIKLSNEGKIVPVESIESYNSDTQQWCNVGECPFPRKQSVIVPYSNTLVEIGGTRCESAEDTMESFLCGENGVVHSGEQFRLPEPIQYSQVVCLDSVFYIMWENSKKFISLNPSKRTFRNLAPMLYTHVHGAASVVDGKIYVSGGLLNSKPSRFTECYDPDTNTWTQVKSLPVARACQGCVTIQIA